MNIERLKQAKKEKKLSYDDLAQLTGYSRSTITNIFCGYIEFPRHETMQAIERALGLAPTFTAEEKAMGVGARPIVLSDKENDWLDTLNRAEEAFGEQYVDGVMLAIKVNLNNLKK